MQVFAIAKRDGIGTHTAADRLAEERIAMIGRLKQTHQGPGTRPYATLKEMKNR